MAEQELGQIPSIEAPEAPGRINPELYINRELSWIEFNRRVLGEAKDPRNPLLERVKFVSIFSSNLDEFFMIRVSGVQEQIEAGVGLRSPDGRTPHEQLHAIRAALLPLVAERQRLITQELLPALRDEGIWLLRYDELKNKQRTGLREYFMRAVFPVLTPLAIDPSHRFPFISNLSLNLLIVLDDAEQGERFARLKVPEGLPRLVRLPGETNPEAAAPEHPVRYVWLEEVIAANLDALFPGRHIREMHFFRVTRDADMEIREDEASDLLETMEEMMRRRRFGEVVRLSLNHSVSPEVRELLVRNLGVNDSNLYEQDGPLGLSALLELLNLDRPDLKDPPFVPAMPPGLHSNTDLFAVMRHQDILLHHPFESFTPLIDLLNAAVHDPQVLAIKQTLYRVGRNSPVVQALLEAREEGKQVAVLVELKARFDEENNIEWATALENAGVHVGFGLLGLKTHAKMLLIVRREGDILRRYMHLGTGNYNASTARVYTDLGLLTCDPDIAADVSELFNVLTGYSDQRSYRKLLVAPHELYGALLAKIERETARQREWGDGHMILKCNGLDDEGIILALYRAAQAGVKIDLLVRGICSLSPGIPGLSETVRVRSIVGRFLEHNRIYWFRNGGDEELYIGSADLMARNLHKRIETVVPISDAGMLRYLRDVVLEAYLQDNTHAHELGPDGSYVRCTPDGAQPRDAQAELLARSQQREARGAGLSRMAE